MKREIFVYFFIVLQDIQHTESFAIESSKGKAKLDTSEWPLLLKVFIINLKK